jgi:dethiobiotin synthetase
MKYLANSNRLTAALKPIASGVMQCEFGLLNEDVYQLFKASNYALNFVQINPFSFRLAIAPHIAAKQQAQILSVAEITNKITQTISQLKMANHVLIEGIGGLMVPLNEKETYLDLLIKWKYPIILVVGMRIGCLNHALLTETVLKNNHLPLVGWVANQVDPQMSCYKENLNYLKCKLSVPLLASISYQGGLQPTKQFRELFQCH